MPLPSLSDYQAAFSNPATCLYDPSLQRCTIAKTPLGQPRVRSGGFALTYCLESGASKWAVRCFHRESTTNDRDRRYQAIAGKLHEPAIASSGYFIGFDFQKQGIMVGVTPYPIVKMAWASGETLASFLEDNHDDPTALGNLRTALRGLRKFLFNQHIAHGDIQPGNLMVSDGGRKVQLIDYDGMYVPAIASLGAAEIGLPNYQHPERIQNSPWSEKLDYFPFILLDLALTILIDDKACWDLTQSSDEKLLFDATDFQTPYASETIKKLIARTSHGRELRAFQAICSSSFANIPHPDAYESFVAGGSRPAPTTSTTVTLRYHGAFPVVQGDDMLAMRQHCGNVVEMIGRVKEVKLKFTRTGRARPYVFVSFQSWNSRMTESFRFVIWSETLSKFKLKGIEPQTKYNGQWVTMSGLLHKYVKGQSVSYQMIVDSVGGLQCITEDEARFRCGGQRQVVQSVNVPLPGRNGDVAAAPQSNADILTKMRGTRAKTTVRPTLPVPTRPTSTPRRPTTVPSSPPGGSNADRLQQILSQKGSVPSTPSPRVPTSRTSVPSGGGSGCCLCLTVVIFIFVFLWSLC